MMSISLMMLAAITQPAAQPLTLEDAIADAESSAPEIAAADADVDAASARMTQARAAGRPSATAAATIGAGRLDPGGFFGLTAKSVIPRAVTVTIEQPLFTGGRVGAGVASATAGKRIADANRIGMRAIVAAQVAEAFGNVLVAEDQRRLYEALVATTTELARQARDRFETGAAPRTDLSQANARLAEARAQLAAAQGNVLVARARLANLIGHDPGALAPLPPPPTVSDDLEAMLTAAEQDNPSIVAAMAALDAALATERGARADRSPSVGVFAEGASVRDQFFPGYRGDSATVGLRARWQFSDGGKARGKIAEASAGVSAARARLATARNNVREAVTAGIAGLQSARLVARAATERLDAAEEVLRNVREEVKVGEKSPLALLDAERDAIAAAAFSVQAQADVVVAAYRVNALLGRY